MRRDGKAYVGIDIGTSSVAAVIIGGRGEVLTTRTVSNPSACEPTEEGRHEQDADAILKAVNGLIDECETFIRTRKLTLAAIGWTGQMHGLVAVDRKLRALTPFVTWRDVRCAPPRLGSGILEDWRSRKVKGIHRVLTIPGYVIARRTGRCIVDRTFRASMGTESQLKPFEKWLPETDDSLMLGDNQAGVYAALRLKPKAAVVNLGTSGQLSMVGGPGSRGGDLAVDVRPFPGGETLRCRASHVGGAQLAKLRRSLGYSWRRLNAEAATNPRIVRCVSAIVDDLAKGMDMRGIRTIVGIGTALRLNPCLKKAVEKRFHARCVIPEIEEMAAWGAALYVRDVRAKRHSEMVYCH